MDLQSYIAKWGYIAKNEAQKFQDITQGNVLSYEDAYEYGLLHLVELFPHVETKTYDPAQVTSYLNRCLSWFFSKLLRTLTREYKRMVRYAKELRDAAPTVEETNLERDFVVNQTIERFRGQATPEQATVFDALIRGEQKVTELTSTTGLAQGVVKKAMREIQGYFGMELGWA